MQGNGEDGAGRVNDQEFDAMLALDTGVKALEARTNDLHARLTEVERRIGKPLTESNIRAAVDALDPYGARATAPLPVVPVTIIDKADRISQIAARLKELDIERGALVGERERLRVT